MGDYALEVRAVQKFYRRSGIFNQKKQPVLNGVSFAVRSGACVGLVGESGSGKSTLGRLILGIETPDAGEILLYGADVRKKKNRQKVISAVFQDYTSSMAPNHTVYQTVREVLRLTGLPDDRSAVAALLAQVGLDASYLDRRQHELSGGQIQRVCIARAIGRQPKFLLLDEALSSLDVSVQVQILQLLKRLRQTYRMGYLFITHDIQAAAYICDELIIFNEGAVVEQIPVEQLARAETPYARKLLHAVITV